MKQLEQLLECEKQVKDLAIENSDKIEVFCSKSGDHILIRINNIEYCSLLKRGLMHQLGTLIFDHTTKSFQAVQSQWETEISQNPVRLKERIVSTLKSKSLILKYLIVNGKNEIYGIVSPQFQYINQMEFRNSFLDELRRLKEFKIESSMRVNQFGQIEETFTPSFCERNISYKYKLIHANNNGYSAIKMHWGREIIICSNGLTQLDSTQFVLTHKKSSNPFSFIEFTINEGIKNYNFLNNRIEIASGSALNPSQLNDFLGGMTIARATKDRITDRFKIEQQATGQNEWSLSQSLTWLAQHEKAIGNFTKGILRDTGTAILENGLDNFIGENRFTQEFDKKYVVFKK
ncbi:MAG: hypothetical protein IPP32_16655 [Bacteroidetes bacterium]|nr:hypothetical protein [Bacteroidota bacterium]